MTGPKGHLSNLVTASSLSLAFYEINVVSQKCGITDASCQTIVEIFGKPEKFQPS
jgi:hypothetical protein